MLKSFISVFLTVIALIGLSPNISATVLDPMWFVNYEGWETRAQLIGPDNDPTSYNSDTDIFISTALGTRYLDMYSGGYWKVNVPFGNNVFTLNAIIQPSGPQTITDSNSDEKIVSGNTLGGVVSWVGSIPNLGIGEGTTLLLGDVIDGVLINNSFNFLIDVKYSEHELDFADLMVMSFSRTPSLVDINRLTDDPFNYSFTVGGNWSYDYLYDYIPIAVPEPSSLLLMGIGLSGLIFVRRRKQS